MTRWIVLFILCIAIAGCAVHQQISLNDVWIQTIDKDPHYLVTTQGMSRTPEGASASAERMAFALLMGRYSADRLDRGKVGVTPPLQNVKIIAKNARPDHKFWIVQITVAALIPEDAR